LNGFDDDWMGMAKDQRSRTAHIVDKLTAFDIMNLLHSVQEARPKTQFRG